MKPAFVSCVNSHARGRISGTKTSASPNGQRPPNSALKLTVRRPFSRRPSRLPRLEFARCRAACTGIIGCAASGAPLDADRLPAARNLTSRRWDDTESHVARSSPALSRTFRFRQKICVHCSSAACISESSGDSEESLLISWRGPIHKPSLPRHFYSPTRTNSLRHRPASIASVARSRRTSPFETRRLAKFLARGTSVNIALGSWDRSRRRRCCFVALLVHSPDRGVTCRASRFRLR